MKFWRWLRWRLLRRAVLSEAQRARRREQPATLEGGGSHLTTERTR